jgi:hypothetical protein
MQKKVQKDSLMKPIGAWKSSFILKIKREDGEKLSMKTFWRCVCFFLPGHVFFHIFYSNCGISKHFISEINNSISSNTVIMKNSYVEHTLFVICNTLLHI